MLRTTAGSHERFLVIEVFGRYAGFTALMPTLAGAADRCVIPEYPFEIRRLTELLVYDWNRNPSRYSVVLVSEGAKMLGSEEFTYEGEETDQYGHKKLGGVGDRISTELKRLSAEYNKGHRVNVVNQRLGYIVRCGEPDALDSVVPTAFGNIAMDLVLAGRFGKLVAVLKGRYGTAPIGAVTGSKKLVDVGRYYNTDRLRPEYGALLDRPLLIMTSD
jgi:6-phosphofructokinase 1